MLDSLYTHDNNTAESYEFQTLPLLNPYYQETSSVQSKLILLVCIIKRMLALVILHGEKVPPCDKNIITIIIIITNISTINLVIIQPPFDREKQNDQTKINRTEGNESKHR